MRHAPAGYRKLPPGKACTLCPRLYETLSGEFYCCTDLSARNTTIVAPDPGGPAVLGALAGPAGRIM